MPRSRCLSLATEIVEAKTWVVGFTGGEVLMWPHLFDVIRILKSQGIVVYIVTNGLLLEEKADDIISSGVDSVVISIDSDDSGEHDDIRKVQGLYQKAISGIEKIKTLRSKKIPFIKTTTVVSQSNLEALSRVISALESIGDQASIQPIVGNYDDHPHSRSNSQLRKFLFEENDQRYVERAWSDFIQRFPSFNSDYFRLIPTFWFNPQYLADTVKCWSPFLRLQIMPDGETRQCTVRSDYGTAGNTRIKW